MMLNACRIENIEFNIAKLKITFRNMSASFLLNIVFQIAIGKNTINNRVRLCILLKSRFTNIEKYKIAIGAEKTVK